MNRAEIETFKRRLRDLRDRYEHALQEIERDEARRREVPPESIKGQGRSIALEAQTRLYVLDPILRELGWDLATPAAIVVEDTVAPVDGDADAHRRRLDYHGRDNGQGRSLLAAEAKRPRVGLPPSEDRSVEELLASALRSINTGDAGDEELPAAWLEILESAVDYVKRITAAYGDVPTRFVITNGEWFLVFSDLNSTLLAQDPVAAKITLFADLAEVTGRADQFCALLGYRDLSGHIPAQHPAALADFVPAGQEAVCARVLNVSYTRHGERQPLISVSVGVWIRTPIGAWILFQKNYPKQFLVLSDDRDDLANRRGELNARAEDLLADLRIHREVRFASREEFEGTADEARPIGEVPGRTSVLMRELAPDRYQIVTTEHLLYFTDDGTYETCPYHNWGLCQTEGNAVGDSAVTAPSSDPRCFFPSGSPYHCAHAAIQARRNNICLLLPFEEHLCCQRCVFLNRCWPNPAIMPCQTQ